MLTRLTIRHRKKKYLKELRRTGLTAKSRRIASIGHRLMKKWREESEDFCKQEIQAQADHLEQREHQIDKRAFDGVKNPVFYDGEVVGHRTTYSDTLAMFRLRALAPDKYTERKQVDLKLSGTVTVYLPDNGREAKVINQVPDRGIE